MNQANNKTELANKADKAMDTMDKATTNTATVRKVRPYADIYENQQGANLYVDLPGVSKESLDISVDKNVLTLKGDIIFDLPDGLNAVYNDVNAGAFERSFTLSDELDTDGIEAKLDQGQLNVFIPKSEKHQPRKIEVSVA